MGFQKFTRAEDVEVLSPEGHQVVNDAKVRTAKTSVNEMTEAEKAQLQQRLETTDE